MHVLHNDYYLSVEKNWNQRKMLSKYQVMIANLYIIPIGNVEKSIGA